MADQSTSPTNDGWWLSSKGAPTGPHSPAYILAGLKTGAISPQINACPVGGQQWKRLGEWPAFATACPLVPPPPPPELNAPPASKTTSEASYSPYYVTLIVIFALGSLTIGFSYLLGLCFIAVGVSICNFIAGKNNERGTAPLDRSIMILAVVSLLPYLGWLTQIAALVLSIIALRKYKAGSPEHREGQLREPWLLYGGLLWGIGLTVCGIGLMVRIAGSQSGYPVANTIGGFIFVGALAWTCFGLLDKYVIHRGHAAVLRPRLRLFAIIFGVTGLLLIIASLVIPAIHAVRQTVRQAKTIAEFTEAIRLKPDDAVAYNNRGNAYANNGDWDRAITDFTESIRLNPQLTDSYVNRGLAYGSKGDFDKEIADCTEAIRLNPQFAEAYYNRGLAYDRKGDLDKAIADFTEAIRLNPQFAWAYHNRGLVYENNGDHDKAIVDLTEAIRLDPKDAGAYNVRGLAFENKGDVDKAIADLNEGIRQDPSDVLGHNGLAWLYATSPLPAIRDSSKALQHARTVCELTGWKQPSYFDTLAAAYAAGGNYGEAVTWQEKAVLAIEQDTDMPEVEKEKCRERLLLYKQGKPYTDDAKGTSSPDSDAVGQMPRSESRGSVAAPTPSPALPAGETLTNSIGMKLALIPAGEFLMGSFASEKDAFSNEKPQHRVRITRPFYLGVCPVTQKEFAFVTGWNPSYFSVKGEGKEKVAGTDTDELPVEQVSWRDAMEFCQHLSALPDEVAAHRTYRLPTEAEWEYACRAGSTTKWFFGDDESSLGEYAWYEKNSESTTHPVGEKKPNAWGLYDMHGNVWQWCVDWYSADYYKQSAPIDPTGPRAGSPSVARGGSWDDSPSNCRSAFRHGSGPDSRPHGYGFRVACVVGNTSNILVTAHPNDSATAPATGTGSEQTRREVVEKLLGGKTPNGSTAVPGETYPQNDSTSAEPSTTPPLHPTPQATTQKWLDELRPVSHRQARGALGFNTSIAGNPLNIGGKIFTHGLGTHADAETIFDLGGQYSRFQAECGIDVERRPKMTGPGAVVFEVWADGEKLYDSGVVRQGALPKRIDVDIRNRKQLRLVVTATAHHHDSAHADWADARLILAADDEVDH